MEIISKKRIRAGVHRFEGKYTFWVARKFLYNRKTLEIKWKLEEAFYQSHRRGKKIKRNQQIPRYKHLGFFETLKQCQEFIEEL